MKNKKFPDTNLKLNIIITLPSDPQPSHCTGGPVLKLWGSQ